jgi:citrate synthase
MEAQSYDGALDRGLEGVLACTSQISTIHGSTLLYRGYRIEDLAENAGFE